MPSLRDNLSQTWARFGPRLGSRQRTSEIIKTLVIVVPLTLLIWIYAERAQIAEDSTTVLMDVALADPGLNASVLDAKGPVSVRLDLSGPRVRIDQLKTDLEQKSMAGTLKLNLPATIYAREGIQNVDIVPILNVDPTVIDSGVTIKAATPPGFRVVVAKVVSRDVTVVLPPDMLVSLQNVAFDPPRITVRGPEPVMNSIYPGDNATIPVDLANKGASLTGTGTQTIDVPLAPSALTLLHDHGLTPTPSRVKMSFEVGTREREYTIPSVPIVVQKLLTQDRNAVTVKGLPVIQNVRVRGPANLVRQLEGDNATVHPQAVLRIRSDDAGKTDLHRAVDLVGLPPEVKVVGQPNEVDFDVKDSSAIEQ